MRQYQKNHWLSTRRWSRTHVGSQPRQTDKRYQSKFWKLQVTKQKSNWHHQTL